MQASRLEPSSRVWQSLAKAQVLATIQNTPSRFVCLCIRTEPPFNTVVVKVARTGVGECTRGHSSSSRLAKEAFNLSGIFSIRIPRVIKHFAAAGFSLLMVEDLAEGNSLIYLNRGHQVRALVGLGDALACLHKEGLVHRDIKLSNAIGLDDGSVVLIDFELADNVNGQSSAAAGTHGYFPTGEQDSATTHRDRYAFAATIFHAALSRCASALPPGVGCKIGLLHLHDLHKLAKTVKQLSTHESTLPTEKALRLLNFQDWKIGYKANRPRKFNRWIKRAAISTLHHVDGLQARAGGWHNNHLEPDFLLEGINLGAAGIALGLMTIDTVLKHNSSCRQVSSAMDWLSHRDISSESGGLFTGNAGVALALAVAGLRFSRQSWIDAARLRFQAALNASGQDYDLFFGDAGILLAGVWLYALTGNREYADMVEPVGRNILVEIIAKNGLLYWSKSDLLEEDTRPQLGTAHGASGIALALAHWGIATDNHSAVDMAESVLESLFTFGRTSDGLSLRKYVESDDPAYPAAWCHGLLGYLWSILHALPRSSRLDTAITWAAMRLGETPAVADPTFCHGLAGRLETAHMLARSGKHDKFFWREKEKVRCAMRLVAQRRCGHVYWASEDPRSFTGDLWVGSTGAAATLCMSLEKYPEPLLSLQHLKRLALPAKST